MNMRVANSGAKGGGNTGLIIAVIFGFLLSAGTAAWFMRSKSVVDQSQAIVQAQIVTDPPATSSPLCPNNYAPVKDRYGKVYQNSCYADSVGAQYAPTPYTTMPAAPDVDPVTKALLARLAPGTTLPPGTGVKVTRKPVVINQGAQKFEGGTFSQASNAATHPTTKPLAPGQK